MQTSPREDYLVTDVMTATPQKLQLMLVEAAIRSAQRAREKWRAGENDKACEALIRAQEVVGELLVGLNREVDAELVKKVASVYLFVFRNLMEANHERDEKKLEDAIRVLEVERDTWRQVCRQLGGAKAPGSQAPWADGHRREALVAERPAVVPPPAAHGPPLPDVSSGSGAVDDSASSGISLEA